jgi:ferredoxin
MQEAAIGKAAERLIAVLLDDEELLLDTLAAEDPVQESKALIKENGQSKVEASSIPVEKTAVTDAAWVETEDCTSCNECTDKYPAIFKYNEEKQAFIKDPTKGTFAELVKAAENCPAACIHPGTPMNPKESKLEGLIKRAAKFN